MEMSSQGRIDPDAVVPTPPVLTTVLSEGYGSAPSVDDVLRAGQQAEEMRGQTVRALLDTIKEARSQLKRLGMDPGPGSDDHEIHVATHGNMLIVPSESLKGNPILIGKAEHHPIKGAKRNKGTRNPVGVCRVCGEAGHDGRKHRWERAKSGNLLKASTKRENAEARKRKKQQEARDFTAMAKAAAKFAGKQMVKVTVKRARKARKAS